MTNKWIKLILACVLVGMPTLALVYICLCIFSMANPFQIDADMSWIEDHTKSFIGIHKRMPESWNELKNHEWYSSIDGIETRVEINFNLMKSANAGNIMLLPQFWNDARKEVWVYRFYSHPKIPKNQERIMADFFYQLYLSQRAPVPCEYCSANESNENHEQCVP